MRASARPEQPSQRSARDCGERIVVDVVKFRSYLAAYESDIQTLTQAFPDRALLELSYEDLSSNMEGAIAAVLDFLGVERRLLRFQTERQSKGDVLTQITNLDEVAAAHRGTRWDHVPDQW